MSHSVVSDLERRLAALKADKPKGPTPTASTLEARLHALDGRNGPTPSPEELHSRFAAMHGKTAASAPATVDALRRTGLSEEELLLMQVQEEVRLSQGGSVLESSSSPGTVGGVGGAGVGQAASSGPGDTRSEVERLMQMAMEAAQLDVSAEDMSAMSEASAVLAAAEEEERRKKAEQDRGGDKKNRTKGKGTGTGLASIGDWRPSPGVAALVSQYGRAGDSAAAGDAADDSSSEGDSSPLTDTEDDDDDGDDSDY